MFSGLKRISKLIMVTAVSVWLGILTLPAQASCQGCLCPGDPCGLCPLPPMEGAPIKPNESETCAKIRERVPPTSAQPGSNEYFPSLDSSTMACVKEGGDVIRNKQRSEEFPSRFYCKPPRKPNKVE